MKKSEVLQKILIMTLTCSKILSVQFFLFNNTISRVCTVGNCWQRANLQFGPTEQINILRSCDKKSMFIHTRVSAPKIFAKFGCQRRIFCNRKEEKTVSQAWLRLTLET